jgi:hypothetical protein
MTASIAHIENYYAGQVQARDRLRALGEVSAANDIESVLAKNLVVASASYFEEFLAEALGKFVQVNSKSPGLSEFCRRVSQRQYHTWFDWDKANANKFVYMFGDDARARIVRKYSDDATFDVAVRNFMFLGSQRNIIVHRNLLSFAFTDTADEVIAKVRTAVAFVNFVSDDIFGLVEAA